MRFVSTDERLIGAFVRARAAYAAALVVSAWVLAGCSAAPTRPAGVAVGHQGSAWETVFATPEVDARLGEMGEGGEYARRDGALAVREPRPLLATEQWPERERATIERHRRITFPRRAETMIFFLPERRAVRYYLLPPSRRHRPPPRRHHHHHYHYVR